MAKTISPKNSFKVDHKVFLTYCPQYKGSDSLSYLVQRLYMGILPDFAKIFVGSDLAKVLFNSKGLSV
ncbi:Outer membrane receptor proteins, mostly Fe transport [Nostoc flagelliforme CCNUN1]|uniref:Outer membrane receptor proteins, mostly Fe transport n=1 Tax=Nostoc flagelliforme CCNUN1 TaxID=2038116 RepID=A0A2K8T4Y4_9NOSO|nr:Outer membrane receptor proteins, mostly Fe transport [Nostoc flagelliforme CCNUN1]